MGLINRFKNRSQVVTRYKMMTEIGNGYYSWDGNVYHSDLVRACIRPKVKAIGKLTAKHIRKSYSRNGDGSIEINPEPYMRMLLEEPNEFMTMQKMLEKVATQLCLNNNAFILIIRDGNGYPTELYPIPADSAECVYIGNDLYLKFTFFNGQRYTFPYADIIHLRSDFYKDDIFGERLSETLTPLMEIVTTTDQGIVKAIKNSSIIRWLLKFTSSLRPEDLKKNAKAFADNYLNISNSSVGVAAVDAKVDANQITPNDYVPNALQMDRTKNRILELFNTNVKIITSTANEDEENAYFEAVISPKIIQLKNELTRKLFTRRQRSCGNYIAVGSFNLQSASLKTKLNFAGMVDRGAMLPNEWRESLGLAPVPGGDTPLRRLDTVAVDEGGEESEE